MRKLRVEAEDKILLERRIAVIKKEAEINREQDVPDKFVGIAIGYADKQGGKIYLGREIYAMARQIHREWLRRHVLFCAKCAKPFLWGTLPPTLRL